MEGGKGDYPLAVAVEKGGGPGQNLLALRRVHREHYLLFCRPTLCRDPKQVPRLARQSRARTLNSARLRASQSARMGKYEEQVFK